MHHASGPWTMTAAQEHSDPAEHADRECASTRIFDLGYVRYASSYLLSQNKADGLFHAEEREVHDAIRWTVSPTVESRSETVWLLLVVPPLPITVTPSVPVKIS